MRLSKIVLNGFKSFADKTEFDFNAQITAIVGPNGCGKSNVVDAVKWVLGEQSTKSLRSGQMTDVIFSGSANRKPMGMAQVDLMFNGAGSIGQESDELTITRRLYRSGDSEYLINNKPCRLKDVRELFLDTGVGVRAYSIIEQGQIAALLSKSTVERRVIFEEAAGISRYKAHKKEALRKLERTEQNLLRLADIVAEVQRQLRSIKLQAGKARNYLQYSQRLRELRVQYSLSQYHQIKVQTAEKTGILNGLQGDFAAVAADAGRYDSQLGELGTKIIETENQINLSDNQLVAVKSKIEQHQQKIQFHKNRIDELTARKTAAAEQIEDIRRRTAQFESDLDCTKSQAVQIEMQAVQKSEELDSLEAQIHQANMACAAVETELEDEKSGIIDIVRRTAQLHNEIQSIGVYRDNLNGQKDRLSGRVSQVQQKIEQMLADKAANQARLADINKVIDDLTAGLEQKRNEIQAADGEISRINERLAEARENRSSLLGEINALDDMERRREGLDVAVKELLGCKKPYIRGIVADMIQSLPQYAAAVEAALEGRTNAVIVSDRGAMLADAELPGCLMGRVRFIFENELAPLCNSQDLSGYESIRGRLVEFVSFQPENASLVWNLLGSVLLVDSLQSAVELKPLLEGRWSFVTLTGEVLNDDGTICAGPAGKSFGLISRKAQLAELRRQLEETQRHIAELNDHIERQSQHHQHLSRLLQELRTSIYEANTEKTGAASNLGMLEREISRLTQEQPLIAGELESLQAQISQSVQKEYDSKTKLKELEEINTQRNEHIARLESILAEKKAIRDSMAAELTELKVLIGQVSEQRKALAATISSLESQIALGRNSLQAAQKQIGECDEQIALSGREILGAENEISELFSEKERMQTISAKLHEQVREMILQKEQTEQLLRSKRSEQAEIEQRIHAVQMELGQLEVRCAELVQRVRDELAMELDEQYAGYSDRQNDWDAVAAEINDLRDKIERLGNINVDSIAEQQELEKRNEFLTSQIDDLDKSKQQLNALINRLNNDCLEKFAATFETIRGNFQDVFRKLFGGGKADILLENPDDLLESGIEIVARPPGKELRSIQLLSGGEKTMTAIAMLFSIFKTKPSPFCFLDEVDAALDEANNERFNLIVKEFQKSSQFIIITHTKRTMSIADVLFGITMQQKGVSKKVSVTFEGVAGSDEELPAAVA